MLEQFIWIHVVLSVLALFFLGVGLWDILFNKSYLGTGNVLVVFGLVALLLGFVFSSADFRCPTCYVLIAEGAYCTSCGTQLVEFCECGSYVSNCDFCPDCGADWRAD